VDYGVTSDQTPDFTWETPTDPDSDVISYYFCYTDDSTWTTNIVVSPEVTSASYTIPEVLTGGKWYWWKVKATDGHLTKYSNQLWRFAVSLPPSVPTPMAPTNGAHTRGTDFLTWSLSTDPDVGDHVSHYHLQIDDDPDFSSPVIDTTGIMVAGGATEVSIQISDLDDYLTLENKNYYWRVSAIDGFGIECDYSDGSNYFLYLLDFTFDVMLEGPFNGSDMNTTLNNLGMIPLNQPYNTAPWNYTVSESVASIPTNVADWILLELRNTTGDASTATPDKNIYRKAAFVLNDGSLVDLDGASPFEFPVSFDDNVFLVVYHRNHLSIISAGHLALEAGSYSYDFTTGSGKVYGGTSGYNELSPGTWGMASGDANADGFIDTDDKTVEWGEQAGEVGYIYADFNLDGQAENLDKNDKWLINDGMDSQVPD